MNFPFLLSILLVQRVDLSRKLQGHFFGFSVVFRRFASPARVKFSRLSPRLQDLGWCSSGSGTGLCSVCTKRPGQTNRQVVASGRKMNLGSDLRWVAKRTSKFPRKYTQVAKKAF